LASTSIQKKQLSGVLEKLTNDEDLNNWIAN